MLDNILKNAELVLFHFQDLTDFDFGYNEESVNWLDDFINQQRDRDDFSVEFGEKLTKTIGSFLGQCIINVYGGTWHEAEYGWSVAFDEKNGAYPFNKVSKQFENGAEDSIHSFFTSIPVIFKTDKKV